MPRVIHFELQSSKPQETADFYSSIFGWKFDKWSGPEEYWLITTGDDKQHGINGGMMKRHGDINFVNTIDVPSIEEYALRVTAGGGQVVVPKSAISGIGWQAYCKDPDGNVFGIHQFDPGAK